mgnify:CR=1 FL=1|jgi:hypothetical protein
MFVAVLKQNVLSVLGINVANMNRGRPVFYFIILMAFSILFDFIQMIMDGQGMYYSTGAGVWSLLCAIVNFLMKFLIVYCSNQLFLLLGGTWSFSAQFGSADDATDAPYSSIDAGSGEPAAGDGAYSYQADNEYHSPPKDIASTNL